MKLMKRICFLAILIVTVSLTLILSGCCKCSENTCNCEKTPEEDQSPGVYAEPDVSDGEKDILDEGWEFDVADTVYFIDAVEWDIDEVVVTSMYTGECKTFTSDEAAAIVEKVSAISGHSPISGKGCYGYGYSIKLYSNGNMMLDLSTIKNGNNFLFAYGTYEVSGGFKYDALYSFFNPEHYHALLELLNGYFEWQ